MVVVGFGMVVKTMAAPITRRYMMAIGLVSVSIGVISENPVPTAAPSSMRDIPTLIRVILAVKYKRRPFMTILSTMICSIHISMYCPPSNIHFIVLCGAKYGNLCREVDLRTLLSKYVEKCLAIMGFIVII